MKRYNCVDEIDMASEIAKTFGERYLPIVFTEDIFDNLSAIMKHKENIKKLFSLKFNPNAVYKCKAYYDELCQDLIEHIDIINQVRELGIWDDRIINYGLYKEETFNQIMLNKRNIIKLIDWNDGYDDCEVFKYKLYLNENFDIISQLIKMGFSCSTIGRYRLFEDYYFNPLRKNSIRVHSLLSSNIGGDKVIDYRLYEDNKFHEVQEKIRNNFNDQDIIYALDGLFYQYQNQEN